MDDGVMQDMSVLQGKAIIDMRTLAKALKKKSISSIYRLRARGHEPPHFFIGNRIGYKVDDVIKFYLEDLPKKQRSKIPLVTLRDDKDLTKPNFLRG